jgi:predicted ABC-type ATPase
MEQPKLIILGGANGSGKTTLAREFVLVEKHDYLGADEIARELNPNNPENEAISAARLFSQRLEDYLANQKSVLVESTLSGLSLRKHLATAKTQDFEITILFVYLDSPELCIERVAARVAKGGHHVPDADIRRRFKRANINFWNVYKNLADKWSLFYNTSEIITQVANGDQEGLTILDNVRYQEWLKLAEK